MFFLLKRPIINGCYSNFAISLYTTPLINASNKNVIYKYNKFYIRILVGSYLHKTGKSQNTGLKLDKVSFGTAGDLSTAIIKYSGQKDGSSINLVLQFVLTDKGAYEFFYYSAGNDQSTGDLTAIMNSIKFK